MSDNDLYSSAGGALKLKGSSHKKKKKSKKRKLEETEEDRMSPAPTEPKQEKTGRKKTAAEIAFAEGRKKKHEKDLLKKAEKTHKERIMDFNRHLDELSEHYDIPKVSWTK